MQPKFIILKINSRNFYNLLISELTNYQKIKYFSRKINGEYTVVIKCQNFYKSILENDFLKHKNFYYKPQKKIKNNIYLSYIFLYTNISLILSELIIKFFEPKIARHILNSKYSYLSKYEMNKISNILQTVLDSNYPSIDSKKMYLYRKELILNKLLLNFRSKNYIYVNHFAYFVLSDYYNHLEEIIDKTCARCITL